MSLFEHREVTVAASGLGGGVPMVMLREQQAAGFIARGDSGR